APRSYPGYPRWPLPRGRQRWRSSLDRALLRRRSVRALGRALPAAGELGRICRLAHGVCGDAGRGPVPSAGGLQALELYAAVLEPGWLPAGVYHYDRAGHALAGVADPLDRALVPALFTVEGGALIWLIVGDGARVSARYGGRGLRFLLLEAGHLMQNLCLVTADCGLATVPLGGFFERPIARALQLPRTDEVLYAGVCGRPDLSR
ncbi:MAG TPA: SagB/ThcOx family dehydrogenase, partial [Kofleriaceae bacterium]|nr:SagB/ThcOx family dehydrogenase [Kofleriaceae bacterium]